MYSAEIFHLDKVVKTWNNTRAPGGPYTTSFWIDINNCNLPKS